MNRTSPHAYVVHIYPRVTKTDSSCRRDIQNLFCGQNHCSRQRKNFRHQTYTGITNEPEWKNYKNWYAYVNTPQGMKTSETVDHCGKID